MKQLLLIIAFILMIFQGIQLCSAFGFLWRDKMDEVPLTRLTDFFRKSLRTVCIAVWVLGVFIALYAGFPSTRASVIMVRNTFFWNAFGHVIGFLLTLVLLFKNAVVYVKKISGAAKKGAKRLFLEMLWLSFVSVILVFLFS